MSDITKKLIEYLVDMKFEHLSKEDVDKAKLRITDVLGCAIAGEKSSSPQIVFDLLKDWGGKPESTVLVFGDSFTMGDIPLGCHTYNWMAMPIERRPLPHLEAWYQRLTTRPAYRKVVMLPLS